MCANPGEGRPAVVFQPASGPTDVVTIEFTPGTVNVTHNVGMLGEGRTCGSAEMLSLAVPLIYKDGWPLQRRQIFTVSIALHDGPYIFCEDFSYAVGCRGRSPSLPDFWGGPDALLPNYTQAVLELQERSRKPPEIRTCIWVGDPALHPQRAKFVALARNLSDLFDVSTDPVVRKAAIPLATQIEKWACMVDLQGGGFSDRVPLLLSSGRPLLVVQREKGQDFDRTFYSVGTVPEKLKPWVHYVPVAEDLHDLAEGARWILKPGNGEMVARNARAYAAKYFTLDYAVKYIAKEMLRVMNRANADDERQVTLERERRARASKAVPVGEISAMRAMFASLRPNCTPRKPSEEVWNTCTDTSLSTLMCLMPSASRPAVTFRPGANMGTDMVVINFTARKVEITHNIGYFGPDRTCASAEMISLAVPLIYKDGWPLKRAQSVTVSIMMRDITWGECGQTFSYTVGSFGRSPPLPDSAFWGRPDTFFPNYTKAVQDLQARSRKAPEIRKCLWAGNPDMHGKRVAFINLAKKLTDLFDVHEIHGHWGVDPNLKKGAVNLTTQIERWACMVDLQGGGYSGRVPLLLSSGRPLLLVQRTRTRDFDDTFYYVGRMPEKLQPWVHYVPVAEDLHDLAESARWILQPENSEKIVRNAQAFAAKYLTLDYAVHYTAQEMLRVMKDIDADDQFLDRQRFECAVNIVGRSARDKANRAKELAIAEEKANKERAIAEEKANKERVIAEEKANKERAIAEEKARKERAIAEEKANKAKAIAEETAKKEKAIAEEKANKEKAIAEEKANKEKAIAQGKANKTNATAEGKANKTNATAEGKANKTNATAEGKANKTNATAEGKANKTNAIAQEKAKKDKAIALEKAKKEKAIAEETASKMQAIAEEKAAKEKASAEDKAAQMANATHTTKVAERTRAPAAAPSPPASLGEAPVGEPSAVQLMLASMIPGCTQIGASDEAWNSCTWSSLSTAMCQQPSDRYPAVTFGRGNCQAGRLCIEFAPRTVKITHDGTKSGAERKCGSGEMASLAVPLIYKAGWPLKERQSASLSISLADAGACGVNFSYALSCEGKTPPLPDYTFWGRPETFYPNYTQAVMDLQQLSLGPPVNSKCLWAGDPDQHPQRASFVAAAKNLTELFDLHLVHGHWAAEPKLKRKAVRLEEQAEKWACLVDVQGLSFSGRVPLLLSSGRPLLVIRRKEMQDLDNMFYTVGHVQEKPRPWVHYVPVAEDLHDLEENARWILQPENGRRIASSASAFAARHLTLDSAVAYTAREMLKALRAMDR